MTSTAFEKATGVGTVDGPLQGYHREWYVVRPGPEFPGTGRVKVGAPRDVFWFDRRCFASEDELLPELARRGVPRVPPVYRIGTDGPRIHGFVEGTPLGRLSPAGSTVPKAQLDQLMEVFGALARVRPEGFPVPRVCRPEDRTHDGDSAGFLRTLIRHTRYKAYRRHIPEYGRLFNQLGLPRRALGADSWLVAEAAHLTGRPYCLLHGDLHRSNFIVDASGGLWTLDWELALFGDPLYDLATHLYLMRYPPAQQRRVVMRWRRTMSRVLPGAIAGMDEDLPRYLAYKRAQSVYADIVRHACVLSTTASGRGRTDRIRGTAKTIHAILREAAPVLGLRDVPNPAEVEDAYGAFGAVRQVRARR